MALSMTGYGRAKAVLNGRDITVEIKSVNSRYFEYSSRLPRSCAFLDDSLKKMLGASISRGKVELSLQMQSSGAQEQVVDVNLELARSYRSALRLLSDALDVKDATTVETLASLPDVLTVRTAQVDEEQLSRDVSAVCAEALQNFLQAGSPGRGRGPGGAEQRRPGGSVHPAAVCQTGGAAGRPERG